MDADALASAERKLGRADTHLHELWCELSDFTAGNPYTLRSETNLNTSEQTIRCFYFVDKFMEMPGHWPLVIGDAIQNMRAAIDHATWGLVISERGRRFAKRNRKSIYFPICTTVNAFEGHFVTSALQPEARAVLEELQPYSRDKHNPNRVRSRHFASFLTSTSTALSISSSCEGTPPK